jgi:murein L,D-transpeptidase YcbB/YkuD
MRILYLPILLIAYNCFNLTTSHNISNNKIQNKKNTVSFSQKITLIDSLTIVHFTNEFSTYKSYQKGLIHFYNNRIGKPYWIAEDKISENGKLLLDKLKHINEEGLHTTKQSKEKIDSLFYLVQQQNTNSSTAEVLLTCLYLQYANYTWLGINSNQIKQLRWNIPPKKITTIDLLNRLSNESFWIANPPIVREYELLKAYLNKYQDIKKNKMSFKIKNFKKFKILPGQKDTLIATTRKFFYEFGFLNRNNLSEIFDSSYMMGLHEFQQRMGLAHADILSNSEINEMNISIDDRINQIRVNMERLRWLPLYDKEEKIVINIPEFKLHLFNTDSLLYSMKVIIGKTFQPTAVFKGDIEEIILCPYWNIPPGILQNEILPAVRKNSNYLKQNHMEWYGSNIRQKPGYDNALGWIKFLFPNRYNIYMHDTPNKYLFEKNIRTFSHGCIRLENAKKLAVYLLRNTKNWNSTTIDDFIQKKRETKIKLNSRIPVYIVYRTAWVDKDGKLNLRKDIYGKDKLLLNWLDRKSVTNN